MKAVLILHLAVLGLVRADAKPKVLEFELSKVAVAKDEPAVRGELAERGLTWHMHTFLEPSEYVVLIRVGSPRQVQWLGVHTASSKTWITCRNNLAKPIRYPYFDPEKSHSHKRLDHNFTINKPDQPVVYGHMIDETVGLDTNTSIENVTLGAIPQSKSNNIGQLGLAAHNPDDSFEQPTFLDHLHMRKIIKRRAYSLNFEPNNYYGRILFGGIDKIKFIGELAVLRRPPNPSGGKVEGFFVGLSGVDIVTYASNPVQVSVPAEGMASLLDTSVQFSFLPQEIVSQIADNVGAFHDGNNPMLMIDCMHKLQPNPQARVTFTLPRADGGAPLRINIPLADLTIETYNNGKGEIGDEGESEGDIYGEGESESETEADYEGEGRARARAPAPSCMFGIQANSLYKGSNFDGTPTSSFAVFGQTILQHLYMVADIDNDQIAMAPVNPGTGPLTNIFEFSDSSDGIPALRGVDSPNEQGQAPPRAPEDEATDMEVDKQGNSEVGGAGESGYLGTAKARGSDEVGTSAAVMAAAGSPERPSSRHRDRGQVSQSRANL